jgi:acetyltransferase-like isoleucine patch superfamily enzyme
MKIKKIYKYLLFYASKIIHFFAEFEAFFSRPGYPLFMRKLEFMLAGVQYEEPIWVGANITIHNPRKIKLGSGCALPENTQLINHEEIIIGTDFISAPDLVLNTGGHDPITMRPICKPIKIGDRVWCGHRVTILAGVTLGNDVIVAAGSVVNRDIPANSICAGVPAKVIKFIDRSNVDLWKWYKS